MFGWFNKQAQRKAKQKPLTVHEIIEQRKARLPERRRAANPSMEIGERVMDAVDVVTSDDYTPPHRHSHHHPHDSDSSYSGHSHSSHHSHDSGGGWGGGDSGGGDGGGGGSD